MEFKKQDKYLFDASDYSIKLEQFERGKITSREFADFDKKFEDAERKGRVRPSP